MLVGTAMVAMLGGVPSSSDFSSSILGIPGTSEESSFSIFLYEGLRERISLRLCESITSESAESSVSAIVATRREGFT